MAVHSPRRRGGGIPIARIWSVEELAAFLVVAKPHRLYPALHLAAHTGMRRGEVVGLKWSDLDHSGRRLSIHRTIQAVGGRAVEFGAKTLSSRRTVDLDESTVTVLRTWRHRLQRDDLPHGPDDWMFCNPAGRYLNPQSLSQLFARLNIRSAVPKIRPARPATHARVGFSLHRGRRSRSSPNGSATRTRPSPCTPTSTCSPA